MLFCVMTLCNLMDGSVKISLVVCGVIIFCSSVVGYQTQECGMCSGDSVLPDGWLSR